MTDEQDVRDLLSQAAELPDSVQPPVGRLIELGRARRTRRALLSAACAAIVVAAAATLPSVLSGAVRGPAADHAPTSLIGALTPTRSGPSAAELSGFRWSALPPSPLGARSQSLLTWTGKELIELGGIKKGSTTNDGAAFDVATGRWHRIAPVTGNVGFTNGVSAWTGRQLFVTNGVTASCPGGAPVTQCLPHAGLYDPTANQWKTIALPKQIEGLAPTAAVWTGSDVVVGFAGELGTSGKLDVAAYDPAANRWRVITPALPHGHPALGMAMVATSNRVIVWSLWSRVKRLSKKSWAVYSGVDVLAMDSTGRWTDVTGRWPQHWAVDSPVYASGQILIPPRQIWCGTCSHPAGDNSRPQLASSSTLALTTIPTGPALVDSQYDPASFWLWNGNAVVAANVLFANSQGTGRERLGAWNPATDQWHRLPSPPGSLQLSDSPVWAGIQLLELTDSGALWSFHR